MVLSAQLLVEQPEHQDGAVAADPQHAHHDQVGGTHYEHLNNKSILIFFDFWAETKSAQNTFSCATLVYGSERGEELCSSP